MKKIFSKRVFLLTLFTCLFATKSLADCTVYFFVDFRFSHKEYMVKVNGRNAFKLEAEKENYAFGAKVEGLYKMVARKVIFKKADTYVISCDCATNHGTMTAELNLNLEDGETYYVVFNAGMKNPFYAELLTEKKGLKLLKKAQTNKKYTINKDIVYYAK